MFVDNFEGRVGEKKKKERKEAMDTTQIYFFIYFFKFNLPEKWNHNKHT